MPKCGTEIEGERMLLGKWCNRLAQWRVIANLQFVKKQYLWDELEIKWDMPVIVQICKHFLKVTLSWFYKHLSFIEIFFLAEYYDFAD